MSCLRWMGWAAALGLACVEGIAWAQVAITEVHSNASTNGTPAIHADWWELTNYGPGPADLAGYRFNDSTGGLATGAVTIESLVLAPGESAVFVEAISADAFRQWWGPSLPPGLQVLTYATNGIGLSSSGDGLRLWAPGATSDLDSVDVVDFGATGTDTSTFVYDPVTGAMSARPVAGVAGAFAAADNGDVGSPGVAGPIAALEITGQPVDSVANPGSTVTLTVTARGLPRPRYQWSKDGVAIAGAVQSKLVLTNVQAGAAGVYSVQLSNGLGSVASQGARVSMAAAPAPPSFTVGLTNQAVLAGSTATWVAEATGVPQPTLAWFYNDVAIPGQTGSTLLLTNITAVQQGTYKVTASNGSGSVSSSATLTVRAKPLVRITEVRSTDALDPDFSRRNGFAPQDWFEVTSFEAVPIALKGWRVDDNSASLAAAFTVTNDVVLPPGGSVIFVERLTPEQFRTWWGTNELPAGLAIITYGGSGFGLSSGGDGVRVWDATATANADTVASVDFPAGTAGVTFNYDPDTGVFGGLSEEGVRGVYQAPGSIDRDLNVTVKDIGSPGRIRSGDAPVPPTPPVASIVAVPGGLSLRFTAEAGRTYRVEKRAALGSGSWTTVASVAGVAGTVEQPLGPASEPAQFYRVVIP